jgi:hypothetical protein
VTLMGYPAVFHPSVILIVIPVEVLVWTFTFVLRWLTLRWP